MQGKENVEIMIGFLTKMNPSLIFLFVIEITFKSLISKVQCSEGNKERTSKNKRHTPVGRVVLTHIKKRQWPRTPYINIKS